MFKTQSVNVKPKRRFFLNILQFLVFQKITITPITTRRSTSHHTYKHNNTKLFPASNVRLAQLRVIYIPNCITTTSKQQVTHIHNFNTLTKKFVISVTFKTNSKKKTNYFSPLLKQERLRERRKKHKTKNSIYSQLPLTSYSNLVQLNAKTAKQKRKKH